RTQITRVSSDTAEDVAKVFAELSDHAAEGFEKEGIETERRRIIRRRERGYAGQNYELPVELPEGPIDAAAITSVIEGFQHAHDRMYGYSAHDEEVQAITFRLQAIADVQRAEILRTAPSGRNAEDAIFARRNVYLAEEGDYVSCPVYDRRLLDVGHRIVGPAVIEQMDTTTLLLPSHVCAL